MKTIFSLLFLLVAAWLPAQAPRLVVPIGHTNWITSVAFSPDGKYVLTGSKDGSAKLWDLGAREIQSFVGHTDEVTSVAFSPDGKSVLTGSWDNTAKLWDLNGKEILSFLGHTGMVTSVAFSSDGKFVLTGSGDYTVRRWYVSGEEFRILKVSSSVSSVAFSPDGKSILTGTHDSTYLWDMVGRKLLSLGDYAEDCAIFSPDGKYILIGGDEGIASLYDRTGKRILAWRAHRGQYMSIPPMFGDIGQEASIGGITYMAFSPDGNFILTGSRDSTVKLWNLAGAEITSFKHSAWVSAAAFSPDGKLVLTSSFNGTAALWNVSGKKLQALGGQDVGPVASALFSRDGKYILAGGKYVNLWDLARGSMRTFSSSSHWFYSTAFSLDGRYIATGSPDGTARLFTSAGKEIPAFLRHLEPVRSVAFSPDGKYVLTSSEDSTARVWDLSGRAIGSFKHADGVYAAIFSPNGKLVLTGCADGEATLWNLSGEKMQSFRRQPGYDYYGCVTSVAFSPDANYVLTTANAGYYGDKAADNGAILWSLDGKELQSFAGHSKSVWPLTFSPDGKSILTGSRDQILKWNLAGEKIQSYSGHSGFIWSVAFSPDGNYVLTGSDDYTSKIWDAESGRQIATLVALDSVNWVVTTPSGLFDASPGAMKLMYYVQGLDVIDLEQLKERYYQPGLLTKIVGSDPGELRNVAAFDQVALYPEIKAGIENNILSVQLSERTGGLGKLSLFINDKEVQEDLNPNRQKTLGINLATYNKYYRTDTINTLALRAYNAEGWLKSQAYELAYLPAENTKAGGPTASPGAKTQPHFYALVVGTSNYAGEPLDLRFADLDAEAMASAFQRSANALFGPDRTQVRLLSTLPAETSSSLLSAKISTKTNIRLAFEDIAAQAKPEDVLMIYFSGHGLAYGDAEKAQFYYLTKDIGSEDLSDPEVRKNFAISSDEFTRWLTAIPAQKQVMILDACNAGKVVESLSALAAKDLDPSQIRALDRMKDRTGMFILTGSAADKVSYEASQYGQGLLTYSLLQGMSGLALTEDKRVDVMTLFQYARDKVPELAKGIGGVQTPVLAFPSGGASFDIGIVSEGVTIPVAQVKPVFIRNVFQDKESFDDVLGLTDALETHFRRITAKGSQAELIFVDVKEYENAWSMKGVYTIKDNVVEVQGRLFRGKEPQREFQVNGSKDDVPGLAEQIVTKISSLIRS